MSFVLETAFDAESTTLLCTIMSKFGSDKGGFGKIHNYTTYYYELLRSRREEPLRVFELGLATNNLDVQSNMGVHGVPGASLRGWATFFPNAQVFGADIDTRILFSEDRIRTYYCDQTSPKSIADMWNANEELNENFDVIVEDGLHTFEANTCFIANSIHKLKPGGVYITEDVGHGHLQRNCDFVTGLICLDKEFKMHVLTIPHCTNRNDNNVIVVQRAPFGKKPLCGTVYANLLGRAGNQLFIFANALAYAKRFNKHLQVVEGMYALTPWMHWPTVKSVPFETHAVYEPHFAYTDIPFCDGNIALHGYYQSTKYFEDALDEVQKYVHHPDPELLAAKCNAIRCTYPQRTFVGVHCRYGDYVSAPVSYPLPSDAYYASALTALPPSTVILLYTDDFERARARMCWSGFEIHEIRENDVDTMGVVASLCTYHVIANSSYSWWTAQLSGCPVSQITMPFPYLGTSPSMPKFHSLYRKGCKVLNSVGRLLTTNENGWVFVNDVDQIGEDIAVTPRGAVPSVTNNSIVAYNTLGFCKSRVIHLTRSSWFGPEDGLFIRPDVYAELLVACKVML